MCVGFFWGGDLFVGLFVTSFAAAPVSTGGCALLSVRLQVYSRVTYVHSCGDGRLAAGFALVLPHRTFYLYAAHANEAADWQTYIELYCGASGAIAEDGETDPGSLSESESESEEVEKAPDTFSSLSANLMVRKWIRRLCTPFASYNRHKAYLQCSQWKIKKITYRRYLALTPLSYFSFLGRLERGHEEK